MLILREPHRSLEITRGAEGWKEFLAKPPRHWRGNRAARRLAEAWEASAPEPPPILRSAWQDTPFADFQPTVAIPAYEVDMTVGRYPARHDLLVVGTTGAELGIVMVEGVVKGSLGPHVDEVLHNPFPGRLRRIRFLKRTLGLPDRLPGSTCYQLLDRAASTLLEATRLKARHAAMVIIAFGHLDECYEEYKAYARLLGVTGQPDRMEQVPGHTDPDLWIGWFVDSGQES